MRKKYKKIEEMTGSIIMIRATDIGLGDLAELTYYGGVTKAQVIGLDGDKVYLQVFGGTKGIRTGDELRFLGHPMQVAFSDNLLGRIFNGSGVPIDGKPVLDVGEKIVIDGPSVNPAMRIIPSEMIRTNIPMIDVFNTLVQSQKLPIFSLPGEPYNELLARVALQAEADVILIGGMGLKYDDYLFFRRKMEDSGKMGRTIMFIHTAANPVVECLLVPDMALAAAERFGVEGKRVLVLLTDMTSFADALKEIAILMEQIPSNRGYPGDLYSQLARRYEKAVDFEGAGSITVLTVTTMPGNDVTHPVPDNTGYITEGQFYLHEGKIDPFGSLSRLKQLVIGKATRKDHNDIMNNCIRLYSGAREARNKIAMGFDPSSWDKQLLTYAEEFETRLMALDINLSLEEALDTCWEILANHFKPEQTGIKEVLVKEFWPEDTASKNEVANG